MDGGMGMGMGMIVGLEDGWGGGGVEAFFDEKMMGKEIFC